MLQPQHAQAGSHLLLSNGRSSAPKTGCGHLHPLPVLVAGLLPPATNLGPPRGDGATSIVNAQSTATQLEPRQLLIRLLGGLDVREVGMSEPAGEAGDAVDSHTHVLEVVKAAEQFVQLGVSCLVGDVTDVQVLGLLDRYIHIPRGRRAFPLLPTARHGHVHATSVPEGTVELLDGLDHRLLGLHVDKPESGQFVSRAFLACCALFWWCIPFAKSTRIANDTDLDDVAELAE
jgi:hypothetical protein